MLAHRAFIALGSNIDPEHHLPAAVLAIQALGRISAVSNVYESPPVDRSDQPNYLNAAVLLETDCTAADLCRDWLPAIENDLGRLRDPDNKYASRTIDLDLALYDDALMTIDHRHIPDPEIADRAFLAIPLAELDDDYRHPQSGRSLHAIADDFATDSGLVLRADVLLRPNVC